MSFSRLPVELKMEIALNTKPATLARLCKTNKQMYAICKDPYFWKMYRRKHHLKGNPCEFLSRKPCNERVMCKWNFGKEKCEKHKVPFLFERGHKKGKIWVHEGPQGGYFYRTKGGHKVYIGKVKLRRRWAPDHHYMLH